METCSAVATRQFLALCYVRVWQLSCGVATGAFPVRQSDGLGRKAHK